VATVRSNSRPGESRHISAQRKMSAMPPRTLAFGVFVLLIALNGCGGDNGGQKEAGAATPKVQGTAGFPRPASRSLRELIRNMPRGPELTVGVSLLEPGRNRLAFALFDRGNRQIGGLKAGLYLAKGLDETAHGPWPARYKRIGVAPQYRSKASSQDVNSVYVAHVTFPDAGTYTVTVITELGGSLVATSPAQVTVAASEVPGVGDKAVRIHTPTAASTGGSRPATGESRNKVDLADALRRHRPVLLLFSTPSPCENRLCGPVSDVAEQVKSRYGHRVAFIHLGIYKDNDPSMGESPEVRAWHLTSGPFAFVINSLGRVAARLEGAFSVAELRAAVRRALH
jgi:hypothetical protein